MYFRTFSVDVYVSRCVLCERRKILDENDCRKRTYVRSGKTIFLLADAAGVDLDFSMAIK